MTRNIVQTLLTGTVLALLVTGSIEPIYAGTTTNGDGSTPVTISVTPNGITNGAADKANAAAQAADKALARAEANVKDALNSKAGSSASGAKATALKLDKALEEAARNAAAADRAAVAADNMIPEPSYFHYRESFELNYQRAALVESNAAQDILALNGPQQGALAAGGAAGNSIGMLGDGTVVFGVGLAGVGILVSVLVNNNHISTSATSTPTTTGTTSTSTSTTSTSTTGT